MYTLHTTSKATTSPILYTSIYIRDIVGRGGSVAGLVPCVQKVAGSNPTLAATLGH